MTVEINSHGVEVHLRGTDFKVSEHSTFVVISQGNLHIYVGMEELDALYKAVEPCLNEAARQPQEGGDTSECD